MNIDNVVSTLRSLQTAFTKAIRLGQIAGENSYSDLTRETKVEPLIIVSKELIGHEIMPDVMQGVLNYKIADYSQAVAVYGRINNMEIRRTLGAFNPNRDGSGAALLASINLESFGSTAMMFSLPTGGVPTLEADNRNPKENKPPKASAPLDASSAENEARNMSVGKLVDVNFTPTSVNGQPCAPVVMPIQFRLLASYLSSGSIMNMLASGTDDTQFRSRMERAHDGGISKFVDLILAEDMVQERRKVLFSEDGRVLTKIMERAANNKRAAIATRTPSFATLANIFVITESEVKDLEARFGRPISSESTRESIFRNVFAATLVVVDRGWNNVTFWQRGQDMPSTLDFKQLKASANGKGPDLMDMMKNFNMSMPVF